ncbi:MAG: D-alanyl-D-alanine carboxypeptidase/D-alanyl-D-alanine endopeptidase, partial [Myxococcota bacterium]
DLNHYSNNFIAETLIKTIATTAVDENGEPRQGSFAEGIALARQFLEERVGFVPDSYVFGNGSGLNDVNRVSARQLIQLLAYMRRDFQTGNEFVNSLAVAGTQGTIGFRMKDTVAERRLRAKTGTLRGVSALSGYVEGARGETIAFSILVQGYRSSVSPIWDVQNDIGLALAGGSEILAPPSVETAAVVDDPGPATTEDKAQDPAAPSPAATAQATVDFPEDGSKGGAP